MTIVLKNSKNFEGKLETVISEMIKNNDDYLKIVSNKKICNEITLELEKMELSCIKYYYLENKVYLTDHGIKIELLKADKYV